MVAICVVTYDFSVDAVIVVCGCFVADCVLLTAAKLGLTDSLITAASVVDSVGFLVGKRVASVNPIDEISGFDVVLGTVCDVLVNSGNTLGIKIHSGGYSVLTRRVKMKHIC